MKKLFLVFLLLQIGLFAQLNNTNKWIMRGDDVTLSFNYKTELTNDTLIFVAKASKDITAVRLIEKTTYDNEISLSGTSRTSIFIPLSSGDTDDLTLSRYFYDITRIKNGDTTTIIIGELYLQPDIGTPFDGTDVIGRVTTVSLNNGTVNQGLLWWNDSLEYWEPSNITLSWRDSSGVVVPRSSYKVKIGDATSYGIFSISPTLTTLNSHAFEDYSTLNPSISSVYGYSAFDASPNLTGSSDVSHLVGYQARNIVSGSGSITGYMHGFDTYMAHTGTDTIQEATQVYLKDVQGTGKIVNNYGLLIEPITRGITNNYNIYTYGGKQFLGGWTRFDSTYQSGKMTFGNNEPTQGIVSVRPSLTTLNSHAFEDYSYLLTATSSTDGYGR